MQCYWKVRYFDSSDRSFKDRHLMLDTATLDDKVRLSIEALLALDSPFRDRRIIKYRNLFTEYDLSLLSKSSVGQKHQHSFSFFHIPDYFEDENGSLLQGNQLAQLISGSKTAIMVPRGYNSKQIEYFLSDRKCIDFNQVTLTNEGLDSLAYFMRDVDELESTVFYKENKAVFHDNLNGEEYMETAATSEEIRSFVVIFRRLYMEGKWDVGTFCKAVSVFYNATRDFPISKWVDGVLDRYNEELASNDMFRVVTRGNEEIIDDSFFFL